MPDHALPYTDGRRLAAQHGWREKVLAYVTRAPDELLVFEHTAEYPDAGIQVPAGGVEPGEDPAAAVVREVSEEAGLRLSTPMYLATYEWLGGVPSRIRHFYWLQAPASTPDAWTHHVTGDGDDLGMTFLFRFAKRADSGLITGYGFDSGLPALNVRVLAEDS